MVQNIPIGRDVLELYNKTSLEQSAQIYFEDGAIDICIVKPFESRFFRGAGMIAVVLDDTLFTWRQMENFFFQDSQFKKSYCWMYAYSGPVYGLGALQYVLPFNTVLYEDVPGYFDGAGTFTFPFSGAYEIVCNALSFTPASSGELRTYFVLNGIVSQGCIDHVDSAKSLFKTNGYKYILRQPSGNTIQCQFASTGITGLWGDPVYSQIQITFLGP